MDGYGSFRYRFLIAAVLLAYTAWRSGLCLRSARKCFRVLRAVRDAAKCLQTDCCVSLVQEAGVPLAR